MRNTLSILAAAAALPAVGLAQTAAAPAPVVINELSYNDSGTDDREFVELFNNTNAPIDLSNWTINSDDVNASTTTQTLPAGTIIPANGFLLVGDTALGNQDVVITLALENGPGEIVWLADANGNAVDSFAYDIASGTPGPSNLLEGFGYGGELVYIESTGNSSAGRYPDGRDNNDNNIDFYMMTVTPGAPNGFNFTVALPYAQDFEGLTNTLPSDWQSSFVTLDSSIAGSPNQMGNTSLVTSLPDFTGGGNTHTLNIVPTRNLSFSFRTNLGGWDPVTGTSARIVPGIDPNTGVTATTAGQSYTFGIRGHADAYGDPVDVPVITNAANTYYGNVPVGVESGGYTGIAWSFYETLIYSKLFLVDYNNGGTPIVLEEIDIVAGVNDGWRDLSIAVQGENVVATFDGNTYVHTTAHNVPGQVYMTYREAFWDNLNIAAEVDDLRVDAQPDLELFGNGNANSAGNIPQLGLASAVIQDPVAVATASIYAGNMQPSSFCAFVVGTSAAPPGGFPLAGAGAFRLQMLPLFAVGPIFAPINADGEAFADILLPPSSAFNLAGLTALIQAAEFDAGLNLNLPLAGSQGGRLIN